MNYVYIVVIHGDITQGDSEVTASDEEVLWFKKTQDDEGPPC